MPAPDPNAVWVDDYDPATGRVSVMFETFLVNANLQRVGNLKNRKRRANAIALRVRRDGWRCRWCGWEIDTTRRADANYCREACRKAAARQRVTDSPECSARARLAASIGKPRKGGTSNR
jgi:hypothetical protein